MLADKTNSAALLDLTQLQNMRTTTTKRPIFITSTFKDKMVNFFSKFIQVNKNELKQSKRLT